MKSNDDLLVALARMHAQYAAARIDRAIVRGWVLGLSVYDGPLGDAVHDAKNWFIPKRVETEEIRTGDLEALMSVLRAT